MTKGDCDVTVDYLPFSAVYGGAITRLTRTGCGHQEVYDMTKRAYANDRRPLEPPPRTCPPMPEPWEMI